MIKIYGIDHGSKDGDYTAEVKGRRIGDDIYIDEVTITKPQAPEAGPVGDEFPEAEFDNWSYAEIKKRKRTDFCDIDISEDSAKWGFTKGRASLDAEVAELKLEIKNLRENT